MRRTLLAVAGTVAGLALAACVHVAPEARPAPSRGHGPPPHAPAHGYRAKTPQGVDVVFDTGIGAYVVVDLPGVYWLDERYYRSGPEGWQVAVRSNGPWTVCADADLPPGLRKGKKGKGNGKAKGKNKNGG